MDVDDAIGELGELIKGKIKSVPKTAEATSNSINVLNINYQLNMENSQLLKDIPDPLRTLIGDVILNNDNEVKAKINKIVSNNCEYKRSLQSKTSKLYTKFITAISNINENK